MRSARRWAVLAVGVIAQTSASAVVYGVPFLVPSLRDERGLSLAAAGVVVAAPTVGLMLALVAWGAVVDRVGERLPMASGLGICGVLTGALALLAPASLTTAIGLLALAGVGAASVNAASGRLIMGWFDVDERGVAMGIRQTAQPLGVAVGGLVLPTAAASEGPFPAMLWPALACLVSAVLVLLIAADPPRPARTPDAAPPASPYREAVLYRVHAASALLALPQFAVSAFSLEYLVRVVGWSPGGAGAFVAGSQLAGAAGRIATGWWSDRLGTRLRPMRWLAVASAGVLLTFAAGDLTVGAVAVVAIAAGSVITVADNGLAFVSVAEIAGNGWAGRAIGIQNTTQNIVGAATPPVLGLIIGASSYAVGFGLAALAPLAAAVLTPVASEPAPETASRT